jgi:NAD(P)-dependent dehydrogenase (short-subunit alcohol dehydrogenase family)
MKLEGKVALITGGTSGIGLATAQEFIRQGAKVVVTGRDPDKVAQAAEVLGSNATVVSADITKSSELDELFKQVREKHGHLDILFANAGIAKLGSVESTTEEVVDELFNTNFRGNYFTVQKALPLLKDGGAVVFTTSWFVEVGIAGTSAVSATKAALRSLTRTLASELLPRNIRVNAVSPGVTETPLFGKLGLPEEAVQELGKNLLQQMPMKRFGTVEEIAKSVTFLASEDASYITGVELAVDGGRTQL